MMSIRGTYAHQRYTYGLRLGVVAVVCDVCAYGRSDSVINLTLLSFGSAGISIAPFGWLLQPLTQDTDMRIAGCTPQSHITPPAASFHVTHSCNRCRASPACSVQHVLSSLYCPACTV